MENRRHFVVTKMKLRKKQKNGGKRRGGIKFTNKNLKKIIEKKSSTFLINTNSVGVAAPEI